MLKQTKKWFSLLLTVCLLVGLIATSSFAEENGHTCNVCNGSAAGCKACAGTGQCTAEDWNSETGVCNTCGYTCNHAQRTYCTDPCPTCGKADEHRINSETGMCEICGYAEGNNDSGGDSNGNPNGDSSGDSSCDHVWNSYTGKCNKCSMPCDHPEQWLEYRPYGNSEHSVRCADCGMSYKKEKCVDENKNDSYSCDICKKSVVTSGNGIYIEGIRNYFTFTPTAAGKYIIFCSNPSVDDGIIVEVYLPDKSSESSFDFDVIDTCDISSQGYILEVETADIGKTYTLLCRDHYDRSMPLKYTLNIINKNDCKHARGWNPETGTCRLCSSPCTHVWGCQGDVVACKNCGYECTHNGTFNSETGKCTICGYECAHTNYDGQNGYCTRCKYACMQKINVGDHFEISKIGTSWFSFTPTESGNYTVVSVGKEDTQLYLWKKRDDSVIDFNAPETYRIDSSDTGGLNDNFSFTYNFEANEEYILESHVNDGSYGEYAVYLINTANCSHLWNKDLGKCELCKAQCTHDNYSKGACTTCGMNCKHKWNSSSGVCTICNMECEHSWNKTAGVCTICGMTCEHKWNSSSGVCTICSKACTHADYIKGVQSVVKATTSANGKVLNTCSTCGKKCTASVIAKIASIKLTKTSYVYNGAVSTPGVVVYDAKGKKISSYKATYSSGRKNVGTYTVNVVFNGNYSGSTKLVYTIIPKTPSFKLSKGSKSFKASWSKISSQCSGYQIQYSLNSSFKAAKTKKITSFKKTSAKVGSLKSKKVYYVRMRSYRNSGGKTYYSGWSPKKSIRVK